MASLEELFDQGTGGRCRKWRHYFEIYERYLAAFRGKPCTYLEIGVERGGSLQIMGNYLGKEARIVGIDVNPACAALAEDGAEVHIGDQSDAAFLAKVAAGSGPFDIIVDDGSHYADHQIVSFFNLFPVLKEGGIYIVEDMHAAFWAGPYQASRFGINFYDFARGLVEKLSLFHIDQRFFERYHIPHAERQGSIVMNNFAMNEIFGIHFYDSMIVFEKRRRREPIHETK
jgi:hypothetical protein